jgi:hypothetical protein
MVTFHSQKPGIMRWESVESTSGHELYHLYQDDKKLLSLTLNPFSNSARVECEEQRRVFLIRKEGFLRMRTVIRNEYGVKLGELAENTKDYFKDLARFFLQILQVKDHVQPLKEVQNLP